ncbi:MAG: orotate phosphoribosyltransferase [Deltaproteobacteria bacterium]|nr:orotate phosphoribosyltransferase [Deltaproteobacteria bacterium]MBN2672142.1 orotate phosphoribosyltransferase [Deltaproteobacteria bacterium]
MKKEIAKILLELNAVALQLDPPFTWASGRFSPIYCDNRLIISNPAHRKTVASAFSDLIRNNGWMPDVIAGTATAGIPHAAWVADLFNLPMVYVRGSAKGHGKQNRIEGTLVEGQKVVLIEDLISTGKSSIDAAQGVADAGGKLLGVAAIFTYGLSVAATQFEEAHMAFDTLTSFDTLMDVAEELGTLSPAQKQIIAAWQQDPAKWSQDRGGAA